MPRGEENATLLDDEGAVLHSMCIGFGNILEGTVCRGLSQTFANQLN